MLRTRSVFVGAALVAAGFFAAPSASEAQVIIDHVRVTITQDTDGPGGNVPVSNSWCDAATACTHPIWTGFPVNLAAVGNTLLLSQTGGGAGTGVTGFDFDTSDGNPSAGSCGPGVFLCTMTIEVATNGGALTTLTGIPDANQLTNFNTDPSGVVHAEAANYTTAFTAPFSYTLSLGYADNVHEDAVPCGATALDPDGNCFPTNGTTFPAATVIKGAGAAANTECTADATCWDAGVLLFTALAPELPPPGGQSCTPGFWKTHATNPPWPLGLLPSQTVGSIFTIPGGIPSAVAFSTESLLTALQGGGGPGLDGKTRILLRAAVSAYINSTVFGANWSTPPSSPAQIVAAVNAALATLNQTTINNLATLLDNENNANDARCNNGRATR